MKLFHRTASATAILAGGFRDSKGTFLTGGGHEGVWFSDEPLTLMEGAKGDTVLVVECPDAEQVAGYEWPEDGKAYREWLIPAASANGWGRPIHDHDLAGSSASDLEQLAQSYDTSWAAKAKQVRDAIPFLREHGLLADT